MINKVRKFGDLMSVTRANNQVASETQGRYIDVRD